LRHEKSRISSGPKRPEVVCEALLSPDLGPRLASPTPQIIRQESLITSLGPNPVLPTHEP
jgi:hypothetical protein